MDLRPGSLGVLRLALVAVVGGAGPALAWDGDGHNVIEALAYRTLVEGHGGQPARPDVLRDLINDGALDAPWCFGRGARPRASAWTAPAENPLLSWPQPETDRPDAFFRRQFSDAGQCFHYMGTLTDSLTVRFPAAPSPAPWPRAPSCAATTSSTFSCGRWSSRAAPGTRRSGFGLYEMMHFVEDSFSCSHAQRTPDGNRLPPRLEADREDRRDPDGAREQDSRRRLPPVGRPPGQDVRGRGRCRGLRPAHGSSVRRSVRVPLRGGRPRPPGDRRAPGPRARPAPRSARRSLPERIPGPSLRPSGGSTGRNGSPRSIPAREPNAPSASLPRPSLESTPSWESTRASRRPESSR